MVAASVVVGVKTTVGEVVVGAVEPIVVLSGDVVETPPLSPHAPSVSTITATMERRRMSPPLGDTATLVRNHGCPQGPFGTLASRACALAGGWAHPHRRNPVRLKFESRVRKQ